MESTNPRSGQAIVELTVVLSLIFLVIFLTIKGVTIIKKNFKHDFVEAEIKPLEFDVKLKRDLVFFESAGIKKNLKKMRKEGWKIDEPVDLPDGPTWYFIKKGNQTMLLTDNLGVLL